MRSVENDDGSVAWFNDAGAIVGGVDRDGYALPIAQGAGIAEQFSNLVTYGIRSAIDSKYRGQALQQQIAAQQAGIAAPANLGGLLLLAGAAFLIYKLAQ